MWLCFGQIADGRNIALLAEASLAVAVERHLILGGEFCPVRKRVRRLGDRRRRKWCAGNDFASMHPGKAEQFHLTKTGKVRTGSGATGTFRRLLRDHVRRRRRSFLTKRCCSKQSGYCKGAH